MVTVTDLDFLSDVTKSSVTSVMVMTWRTTTCKYAQRTYDELHMYWCMDNENSFLQEPRLVTADRICRCQLKVHKVNTWVDSPTTYWSNKHKLICTVPIYWPVYVSVLHSCLSTSPSKILKISLFITILPNSDFLLRSEMPKILSLMLYPVITATLLSSPLGRYGSICKRWLVHQS